MTVTTGDGHWADDQTEANLARLEALNNQRNDTLNKLRNENQQRVNDMARLGVELNEGTAMSTLMMVSTLIDLLVENGVMGHNDQQELALRYENQMAAVLDEALSQARVSKIVQP